MRLGRLRSCRCIGGSGSKSLSVPPNRYSKVGIDIGSPTELFRAGLAYALPTSLWMLGSWLTRRYFDLVSCNRWIMAAGEFLGEIGKA